MWNLQSMSDAYGDACFSKNNVYKWAKLFKGGWNCIQDEDMSTMAIIHEIVDLVNVCILVGWVPIGDISQQHFQRSVVIGSNQGKARPHIATRTVETIAVYSHIWFSKFNEHKQR